MSNNNIQKITNIYYSPQGAYLIGFPSLQTVEKIVDSIQQFYQEKLKPTINTFRLFPKITMKQPSRLTGSLLQKIPIIAQQFEYEDDQQVFSKKKSNQKANQLEGALIKRSPLYKLLSPTNPVLRQQYTVLFPEIFKKINSKEQQQAMKEKVRQWVEIGYHIHVIQAFKVQKQQDKLVIFLEKVKGKTLRDWITDGFFKDQNKALNSKRILNTALQIAIGLNYMHRRNTIHQQLIPDHIYIQNDKIIKIGNMYNFNGVMNKINKNCYIGGSPEYWSPQQRSIFQGVKSRAKQGGYLASMKLLPTITYKSDIYQFGLIIIELVYGKRMWATGDKISFQQISNNQLESNANKQTFLFLFESVEQMIRSKPQQRLNIANFIQNLLDFYAKNFKNAEDLLWCRFFDQEKYQSDLLNNKAVGLYLSGNETQCQKSWTRSLTSNPLNLTAQYNYTHFKRMKRIIDDSKLNKDLLLQPQSRKRNYYLLISNLVSLPLLKQPFKTYNFNPKLSKHKQIEILSTIIETLEKYKKPKDFTFQKRQYLFKMKFDEMHYVERYLIGRVKGSNTFHVFNTDLNIKPYNYIEIKTKKEPSTGEGRQSLSCVDSQNKYLGLSDNSYLCIFKIDPIENSQIFHQVQDYGSSITTMQFDQKSQVLGVGSNQFTIKLINLTNLQICKIINIGQKFIIRNLAYYDRNTCIGYSYQKSVSFHRIETTKQLFTIRCNAIVVNYKILEVTLTSHLMIVHSLDKFQIWNLKDKALLRNIEIDQAPKIEGFYAFSSKKIVVHYTKNVIRLWNYGNGLILKTYRTPIPISWVQVDEQIKWLQCLDADGNYISRYVDFNDFIRGFEGICVPNEICMTDERQEYGDEIISYVKLGRQLIQNLNQYRLNEQQKKVSLEKMYRISENIKSSLFYQDKADLKTIFIYLNSIKQSEDRSSRINGHSEQYIFMSRKEQYTTAVSNYNENAWLIGESDGHIRLVSAPDAIHFTIRPKQTPVTYLYLQPTSIFIGYQTTCMLVERESLNIVVSHSSYHKRNIRMGLVLNNILATGDEEELILFWNKQKVRRYKIPVNIGDVVGKKLVIAGFDNRVRLYEMHPENGAQKTHVFVGHVMNIYNLVVIDDSIFTSYSLDGTIRWWNTQVKSCFSYFNFNKYFSTDRILQVDMPKFSLEEEKHAKFNREGCALLLLNNSEVAVFDTMRKEIKWRMEFVETVNKIFWINYPNSFGVVSYEDVKVINIYWRYMMLKKN